jgi:hypothetical protein
MSYCRFHNTRLDLNDCLDALNDGESMSYDERKCGHRMFKDFLEFCQDNGVIDSFDQEAVDALFAGEEEEED